VSKISGKAYYFPVDTFFLGFAANEQKELLVKASVLDFSIVKLESEKFRGNLGV